MRAAQVSLSGRHGPHSSRRCSGAAPAPVLSRVIAPGSHRARTVLPFHPIPQLLGWPLHKHRWHPRCSLLPVPSAAGQGQCSRQKRSLICFRAAVGRTPMASISELHPTLVPISHLQRSRYHSHLNACMAPSCAAAPPWPGKYTPQF